MAQGLLLQLWAPLQFLGWFYRELRQSLVDMDSLFGILRLHPAMADGTRDLPTPQQLPSVPQQVRLCASCTMAAAEPGRQGRPLASCACAQPWLTAPETCPRFSSCPQHLSR